MKRYPPTFRMPSNTSAPPLTGETYQVHVCRHNAVIDPGPSSDALAALTHTERPWAYAGHGGYGRKPQCFPYYGLGPDGHIYTSAGLLPRLRRAMERDGDALTVTDNTRWPPLEWAKYAYEQTGQPQHGDGQLIAAVLSNPRGQIQLANAADASGVVALMERLHSSANVLLVVSNRNKLQSLRRQLQGVAGRPVQNDAQVDWTARPLLLVATGAMFAAINQDDWDVIVFMEPKTVTAWQAFRRAQRLKCQLLYCLTTGDARLSFHERLRLESICGSVIWEAGAKYQQRPVRVELAPAPRYRVSPGDPQSFRSPAKSSGGLDRKRAHMWHNPDRNAAIAQIATALFKQDMAPLWSHGLLLHEAPDFVATHYASAKISILVESAEQGQALQQLLPGWALDSINAVSSPAARIRIVTVSYAAQRGVEAKVLIRATGDGSPLVIKGFPLLAPDGAHPLLIDVTDDFDEQAVQDTETRVRDYAHQGWLVRTPRLHIAS